LHKSVLSVRPPRFVAACRVVNTLQSAPKLGMKDGRAQQCADASDPCPRSQSERRPLVHHFADVIDEVARKKQAELEQRTGVSRLPTTCRALAGRRVGGLYYVAQLVQGRAFS
jgi:hypothetical protein